MLKYLIGKWIIKKEISGLCNGQVNMQMLGKAEFKEILIPRVENSLHYEEKFNISPNIFSKQQYKYIKKNSSFQKLFINNDVFYNIKFTKTDDIIKAHGEHFCLQDRYRAEYFFTDVNNFQLIYYIKGPKKDYSIISEYSRVERPNEENIMLLGEFYEAKM